MGAHMKTTVDIADGLLTAAKQRAARDGTTVRALIEAGLQRILAEDDTERMVFRLRRASVPGEGMVESDASWAELRRMAYEGRGG